MPDSRKQPGQHPTSAFMPTRWTMVLRASEWDASASPSPQSQQAMAELCRAYWYPLYSYVRRSGHSAGDAEDLTQEFFARLMDRNYLSSVDRDKGSFRSFLLAAIKHFLANEWDRQQAKKRGGGQAALSLDWQAAEGRYEREASRELTPEKSFERQWALDILQQVLDRLRAELVGAGKGKLFEELKDTLTGTDDRESYQIIASRLGTTEGAVKVAVHRLRRRYRQLLCDQIAQTVAEPEQVQDEIRHLMAAVSA